MDPSWIALAGAVFGGVGLKVAEAWLGRNRIAIDDATQIRNELRMRVDEQKKEIDELESAVEKWREEYYDLRDRYIQLSTRLALITGETQVYHLPGDADTHKS